MGYSMTAETYEKLKKLDAEGRRCKLDRCTKRATYVLTMASENVKADGTVSQPTTRASASEPYTQAFCGSCMKKVTGAYERFGKPVEGKPGALRYEVETGSGSKQVNTLLATRKLARDEKLSK